MTEPLDWPTAPRTFKRVKSTKVCVVDAAGVPFYRDAAVYLSTAGTPAFHTAVPKPYAVAWDTHRSGEYSFASRNDGVRVANGFAQASTFEAVIDHLGRLSDNYRRHVESISIRKVIVLGLELVAPAARISHERNSFSHVRTLVGMRAEIRWEVNGKRYRDSRPGHARADTREDNEPTEPTYDQLHPCDGRMGNTTTIPYTSAAWATLVAIEDTLTWAAQTLHELTDEGKAPLLLEQGPRALLGGQA